MRNALNLSMAKNAEDNFEKIKNTNKEGRLKDNVR
jgi:hypothetical protein